jgi:tetratricopeptide (TPR) repeat protein
MDKINSGDIVKSYRCLLKISQKEAAGARMSHSMVSLIESGKIQLTTVTAMILADNFNKIAASKGIELNLSLKDLLSNDNYYIKENIKKALKDAHEQNSSVEEYNAIFEKAKENNCFETMAEIKLTLGMLLEQREDFNVAINCYNSAIEYYKFIEDYSNVVTTMIFQARCYNRIQRYDSAEEYIQKAMSETLFKYRDDQLIFVANMELLNTFINTNRNFEALKLIEKILKNKKLNISQKKELLMIKANIYFEDKRYSSTIALLKKLLLNNSSSDYLIFHKLALAYFITGQGVEGSNYQTKCINYLSLHNKSENTKILIDLAEELIEYGLSQYSIRYFEYALITCEAYDQKCSTLYCYRSIFNILCSNYQVKQFENYATQMEQLLFNNKSIENLAQYVLLLSKFYLKTSQVTKLQNFIDILEKAI